MAITTKHFFAPNGMFSQSGSHMPLVKQNVMKFEVFILGGQRIEQKRSKGWWRGSRERVEGSTKGKLTELTI